MDLFGDLPEPKHTVSERQSPGPPAQERSVKRRREEECCATVEQEAQQTKKMWLLRLQGFVSESQGERDEMEDTHVMLSDLQELGLDQVPAHISKVSCYAVFDGHGGSRASRFAAENLHKYLIRNFPRGRTDNLDQQMKKCLVDSFRQMDEEFLKKASSQKPAWKDGCTATCVLVLDRTVYVANLGDSRAVLCRMEETGGSQRSVALALSKEHTPTIYEERMRIQRAGGTVRDGRVLGVLEVSRSIGDGQFKRCGVISTPDLRRCQLTLNDRFLLVACDGLFKVFSPEEAVNFVLQVLQDGSQLDSATHKLCSEAVRRGSGDNVTVILLSVTNSD
ncbi:integrin-linked kinase-associated serine/threonine phosphatase 2C [Neosynchiropus ocellatus]